MRILTLSAAALTTAALLTVVGCDEPASQSATHPAPAGPDTSVPIDIDATSDTDTAVTDQPDQPDTPETTDASLDPNDPKAAVDRTDADWKRELTPEEYYVLRQKGTERPWTNKYDKHFKPGSYACAGCGLILFESDTKFDSECGWPAFYAAKAGDRVKFYEDRSFGWNRVEVVCARCDGHLGHVFNDAPDQPTGVRFCINSVSLKFIPKADAETSKNDPE